MKILRAIRLKLVLAFNALDNAFANAFDRVFNRNPNEEDDE